MTVRREFERGGEKLVVAAEHIQGDRWRIRVGEHVREIAAQRKPDGRIAVLDGGGNHYAAVAPGPGPGDLMVRLDGTTHRLRAWQGRAGAEAAGTGRLEAPMTGTVLTVHVAVGDHVQAGKTVAVMTAMKMEHKLVADVDGTVVEVGAEAGGQVEAGAVVVRIEADADS